MRIKKAIIIIFVFAISLTFFLGIYFIRANQLNKDFEIFTKEKSIEDILKTRKLVSIDALQNPIDYQYARQDLESELSYFKGDNYELIGLSHEPGGDRLFGGGCSTLKLDNYIKINGNLYLANLQNLYTLIQPKDLYSYIDLLMLNEEMKLRWCGDVIFYNIADHIASIDANMAKCEGERLINTKMYIENANSFIYYIYDGEYPSTIYRHNWIIADGKVNDISDLILQCESGVMY
jgi:hypothetical protein